MLYLDENGCFMLDVWYMILMMTMMTMMMMMMMLDGYDGDG